MKLTFETSSEQDAYLTEVNAKSNPDGKTAVEDFAASYLSDSLNSEIKADDNRKVENASSDLYNLPADSRAVIFAAIDAEKKKLSGDIAPDVSPAMEIKP